MDNIEIFKKNEDIKSKYEKIIQDYSSNLQRLTQNLYSKLTELIKSQDKKILQIINNKPKRFFSSKIKLNKWESDLEYAQKRKNTLVNRLEIVEKYMNLNHESPLIVDRIKKHNIISSDFLNEMKDCQIAVRNHRIHFELQNKQKKDNEQKQKNKKRQGLSLSRRIEV
jgi:hypothetical protein